MSGSASICYLCLLISFALYLPSLIQNPHKVMISAISFLRSFVVTILSCSYELSPKFMTDLLNSDRGSDFGKMSYPSVPSSQFPDLSDYPCNWISLNVMFFSSELLFRENYPFQPNTMISCQIIWIFAVRHCVLWLNGVQRIFWIREVPRMKLDNKIRSTFLEVFK